MMQIRTSLPVYRSANGRLGRKAIFPVIGKWLRRNQGESIPLIVAHSHSHDDHKAGGAGLASRSGIMVRLTVAGTQQWIGIERWPADVASVDLGDRIIDVEKKTQEDQLRHLWDQTESR